MNVHSSIHEMIPKPIIPHSLLSIFQRMIPRTLRKSSKMKVWVKTTIHVRWQ